jgi:hypothetical protein
MKRSSWIATLLSVALSACAPAAPLTQRLATTAAPEQENAVPTPLPGGPLAPELKNETWLNSEPLTTADLRGKVVLIDFWTFG